MRDDGRGFAEAAALRSAKCAMSKTDTGLEPTGGEASERHGLLSMRARAAQLGARLHIESAPGAGTTITLRVPTRGFRQRMIMLLPTRLR